MPKTIYCPFWGWNDSQNIHCEGGKLTFHDRQARRDYANRFCGDEQWKKCTLARMLEEYYERDDEDEKRRLHNR